MEFSTKNSYSLFLRRHSSYRFPAITLRLYTCIRLKFEIF